MADIDGRRVYTRGELMELHGLGRSTLEKWFRERAGNGHPEPAGRVGAQLAWDAGEWDRWYAARRSGGPAGGQAGRPGAGGAAGGGAAQPAGLRSRDELAAAHGLSRHRLKQLWAECSANGHPAPARQVGKALYWDAEQWAAWYAEHTRAGAEQTADPDDLITMAEAGRLLGLAPSTVTVYAGRPPAGWPEPAEVRPLGAGRVRRLYRRADVQRYADQRGA